jgi:hypothetical protein
MHILLLKFTLAGKDVYVRPDKVVGVRPVEPTEIGQAGIITDTRTQLVDQSPGDVVRHLMWGKA